MKLLVFASLLLAGTALAGPEPLRDPFRSPLLAEQPIDGLHDVPAIFGQFQVGQLMVLGVVETPTGASALLAGPDGSSHVVRPGDVLGQRWARVTHVGGDAISFLIVARDHEGVLVERRPQLKLPQAP